MYWALQGVLELDCNKYFLPVQDKADDQPERDAPHGLRQSHSVGVHPVQRPVERGDHPTDLVAAVEQDAVHPWKLVSLAFLFTACVKSHLRRRMAAPSTSASSR